MVTAPVNKIIDSSVVDGPGNRTGIFLQGCNIACAYCHNPETQNLCRGCGICVQKCPAGALKLADGKVIWDDARCCQCDTCIGVCPHDASPKVREMTPDEVLEKVRGNMPFIRGITVSGGECMLHPEWMTGLFRGAKELGLTTLIDSNGTVDFSLYPDLMAVCDGVMLDVKSWDSGVFRGLTGHDNTIVKKNLSFLSGAGKLEELRIVCFEPLGNLCIDATAVLEGVAETVGERKGEFLLKLIRFRSNGVRGVMASAPSPTAEWMEKLRLKAVELGFERIRIC